MRTPAADRAGAISNFTGIDDPCEPRLKPELEIGTNQLSPAAATSIVEFLERWKPA